MQQQTNLQQIMNEHTELLFRIAYYYTKNRSTAEDIVQEVFIKFYYQEHYEERNELRAYLAKMTSNKSKDYLKSWAFQKMKLTQKFTFFTGGSLQDELFESTPLEEAVLSLPMKFKEVITYYYYEGFSIKEMAQILSTNENTIKSRMKKAKQLLKDALVEGELEVMVNE